MMESENVLERDSVHFGLPSEVPLPVGKVLWPFVRPTMENLLGLTELGRVLRQVRDVPTVDAALAEILTALGIGHDISDLDVAKIPATGPCLVVANHPFGAAEGLVLAQVLRKRRRDARIVANHWLRCVEPLRELFLFADPFGSQQSVAANARALRECLSWLKRGGVACMFPAGEVAAFDPRLRQIVEPRWSKAIATIVRRSGAPVLPIHFRGTNSALFHGAGLLHPRLRTALLPRELLNKKGQSLKMHVGSLLSGSRLREFDNNPDLVAYVRERTFMLGQRGVSPPRQEGKRFEKIVDPVPTELLEADIQALHGHQRLYCEGGVMVYVARSRQIPHLIREIGRLRELTFRAAGEGTGRAIDLDEFDDSYLHLLAWDQKGRAIVGAYRLGPTDEILAAHGPAGLYSASLFRIKPELFGEMGPALEMGRSFVCDAYRKSASGLYALWRGIGAFVARNPRYRRLFGPVSISASYAPRSRELIVEFLREHDHMHPWQHLVRPRHPLAVRRVISVENGLPITALAADVDEISGMVGDMEADRKGLPVLLRQYLRLGGKMLGFNVDPAFNRALDGLIVVDLVEADPKLLRRYLGAHESASFLVHHRPAMSGVESGVARTVE